MDKSRLAWYSKSVNSNENNSDALVATIEDTQIFGNKTKQKKKLKQRKAIKYRYKVFAKKKYS
jgi:hypothetical protein